MSTDPQAQPFRNISDTARFVALLRAAESDRPDALFRDVFARELAGDADAAQIRAMQRMIRRSRFNALTMAVRTQIIDDILRGAIERDGVDVVLNLAAGLDTRPYRLPWPATLTWVEADFPAVLAHKETILAAARPQCRLVRTPADLRDPAARRRVLEQTAALGRRALVLTEGLLMYLRPEDVAALGRDLFARPVFEYWVTDLLSPEELAWIRTRFGREFSDAKADVHFAPADPVEFFGQLGWSSRSFYSYAAEAPRLHRETTGNRLRRWLLPLQTRRGRERWRNRYGFQVLQRAAGA
jgi:methyltransferase (TIGR00027 family)